MATLRPAALARAGRAFPRQAFHWPEAPARRAAPFAFAVTACLAAAPAAFGQSAPPPPLVAYTVVDGVGVPEPLSGAQSDPRRGEEIFRDPGRGGCLGCHAIDGPADATQIGPSLAGVGARLSRSALRLWIIEPRYFAPDTTKPAYYSLYDGDAETPTRARPRLGPGEIEDLVAYLDGLAPLGATPPQP